jgi:hypothetical protein
MGTFHQWAHSIWFGLFFGVVMSVYNIGQRPSISLLKTVLSTVLSSVLLWFAFGLWESFGSRAFHSPIVFIAAPSGVCGFLISWAGRRKPLEKPQNSSQ